ncbi:MAG TPA: DUF3276 family protein [Bacteroidales bacterium]|nr:DUF3276 family protein [Bacteroidales bacterium]HPR57025.1 DUF3276 family protein [Bacteroidales bacterium]HRW97266.1 DUF3276 family protein [Bacteroidales bacterium]
MEDSFNRDNREDVYSLAIRAGKRTYFFDVKETRSGEKYLTITESKRRFNNESGKFFYEKHKIFLYKEDFEKFSIGLSGVINFIQTGKEPVIEQDDKPLSNKTDISFEDLDSESKTEEKPAEENTDDNKTGIE